MGELSSALDALAADDLHTFPDGLVLDRIAQLVQVVNRATAELTRAVRHAETTQAAEHDGMRSIRSWLTGHARLSPQSASRLVGNGRALEHLPAVAAGFAAGDLTAEQVAVVATAVTAQDLHRGQAQGIDLDPFDRAWAAVAVSAPDQLAQAIQGYRNALDPDGPEPDPTEGRRLAIARHPDGSITGRFDLDPVGGEKVQAALESIVQAARPAGDTRTRSQQQADALFQLADNVLASGGLPTLRTVKPQVLVTIPLADLVDPGTGPGAATTGFGAVLSAARARWVACDAGITRVVLDPDGVPLDYGRTKRLVTAGLRRAVEVRDRHCVFAGCGAPTHFCDVHHLAEWLRDQGETNLENSALLCERHHTKVHHGFRVERPPDGRWRTYRPDDTEILIGPRP